ncbi:MULTISPECIES: hypothetical protein [Clostridium]|nr:MULTISPECIES: hypothetical protein [Clostridium]NOV88331.1 hypothetical protein [Clostridium acetobutylicum]NRY55702.1 hypothetical protein [Clostridium acetobutylicum]
MGIQFDGIYGRGTALKKKGVKVDTIIKDHKGILKDAGLIIQN